MRQVLIRRGQVTVDQVPAPIVENGHRLVEVAYSLISAGTELSSVQECRTITVSKVLEQPERVKKLITHLRTRDSKTIAKVQGQTDQLVPLGYSCSGIVAGWRWNQRLPAGRPGCLRRRRPCESR